MSAQRAVLVTGGAGFLGSHVARLAIERGRTVIVLDDLSNPYAAAASCDSFHLVEGCIADTALVRRIVLAHDIGSVVHFAGQHDADASVREPERYFDVNVSRSLRLLDTVRELGVRAFLYASTAAVHGRPIDPLGASKLAFEYALSAAGVAHGVAWGALRSPETHLIPLAIEAVLGQAPPLVISDGTIIRDHVHVQDLADAFLAALALVEEGTTIGALDLGAGRGYTVRVVIDTVARVMGRPVPHELATRREGDVPHLVVDPRRAQQVLTWQPRRSELETIVKDAVRARLRRTVGEHAPDTAAIAEQWLCPGETTEDWDCVDQASWESFPASDPPACP